VSEVCGANYLLEGGEPVLIKPDSEYPDWLFTMNVTRPLPSLEQMVRYTLHSYLLHLSGQEMSVAGDTGHLPRLFSLLVFRFPVKALDPLCLFLIFLMVEIVIIFDFPDFFLW
jgi:hypothetical protein